MTAASESADVLFKDLFLISREGPSEESFKDIFCSLRGRMAHVFGIETIVTQFVHNYLVCREIFCTVSNDGVDSQQQSCLAELISVRSVLEMTYGTHCEDVFFSFTTVGLDDVLQKSGNLLNLKPFTLKFGGRMLETV